MLQDQLEQQQSQSMIVPQRQFVVYYYQYLLVPDQTHFHHFWPQDTEMSPKCPFLMIYSGFQNIITISGDNRFRMCLIALNLKIIKIRCNLCELRLIVIKIQEFLDSLFFVHFSICSFVKITIIETNKQILKDIDNKKYGIVSYSMTNIQIVCVLFNIIFLLDSLRDACKNFSVVLLP